MDNVLQLLIKRPERLACLTCGVPMRHASDTNESRVEHTWTCSCGSIVVVVVPLGATVAAVEAVRR